MVSWVATSYGALDVREVPGFDTNVEVLVTPTIPGPPLALFGPGAELWRRLATPEGVPDASLSDEEYAIVAEMVDAGLASSDLSHPAAHHQLGKPWLSSPLHELVYALISHLVERAQIPTVFFKGPTLFRQGLRTREHSGDVDVWVQPSDVDALSDALVPWGWTRRTEVWEGTQIGHSATLVPGDWGCEIDVHRRIPGLTVDDAVAFSALIAHTETCSFAGTSVRVPSVPVHAALHAIHSIRPEIGQSPRPRPDATALGALQHVGASCLPALEALGATVVLRPEIEIAFPGVDVAYEGTPRDWAWRTHSSKASAYFSALAELPMRDRAAALIRVIWPPKDAVMASAEQRGDTTSGSIRARLLRFKVGIQGFIRGVRHPR